MKTRLYKLALWYIAKCNKTHHICNETRTSEIKSLKRLTYRIGNKAYLEYGADAEWQKFNGYDVLDNAIQKLADYEDMYDKNLEG